MPYLGREIEGDDDRAFLPDAAACLDAIVRAGHAEAFVDPLLAKLVPRAVPQLLTRDAQTALDIALQLRDHAAADRRGPVPAEWARFRDLAREFQGRNQSKTCLFDGFFLCAS